MLLLTKADLADPAQTENGYLIIVNKVIRVHLLLIYIIKTDIQK